MGENFSSTTIFRTFATKKIITIDALSALLDCSVKTARRRLRQWNAYTSYNENARYYTLPAIAEFDAHGLWSYRQVRFSRHGSLTKTMMYLVTHSPSGLDAAELEDRLGIAVRSLLTSLHRHPEITREKIQGRFVYFAALPNQHTSQKNMRIGRPRRIQLPTDQEAIAILVEAIKHPALSCDELAVALKAPHAHITSQSIQTLFRYHGLTRKKTPSLPS